MHKATQGHPYICLLTGGKTVIRVWAFNLALTTAWELCATNSSIVYRDYTGSCILSQHALLSFHAPGETLLMPLRCFMNTAVIPLNDRWSKMEEEEKCVVLAFIFTAARPWFPFTNDPGVNMCHLWEDQLLLIVWTNMVLIPAFFGYDL